MVDNGSSGPSTPSVIEGVLGPAAGGAARPRSTVTRTGGQPGARTRGPVIPSDWSSMAHASWTGPARRGSARRPARRAASGDCVRPSTSGRSPHAGCRDVGYDQDAEDVAPSGVVWEDDGDELFRGQHAGRLVDRGLFGPMVKEQPVPCRDLLGGARRARRKVRAPGRRARQPRPVPPGVRYRSLVELRAAARRSDVPPVPRRDRDVWATGFGTTCTGSTGRFVEWRTVDRRTSRCSPAWLTLARLSMSNARAPGDDRALGRRTSITGGKHSSEVRRNR